eukprot:TRINITY_DN22841_c0_g1_i1.p1 TRINITY_DN22841_c0_g1~~TRINITY_DN22841_c0_g1_i1.p1  ORF type:complete len:109 (-),score=0.10 TRINITY_DN22841_c0_g1_i1:140-466(-)
MEDPLYTRFVKEGVYVGSIFLWQSSLSLVPWDCSSIDSFEQLGILITGWIAKERSNQHIHPLSQSEYTMGLPFDHLTGDPLYPGSIILSLIFLKNQRFLRRLMIEMEE